MNQTSNTTAAVDVEEARRLHCERITRRMLTWREAVLDVSNGNPVTPVLTLQQSTDHGPWLVEVARWVVEEWVDCEGVIPQRVSRAMIELKKALVLANTRLPGEGGEVVDAV